MRQTNGKEQQTETKNNLRFYWVSVSSRFSRDYKVGNYMFSKTILLHILSVSNTFPFQTMLTLWILQVFAQFSLEF